VKKKFLTRSAIAVRLDTVMARTRPVTVRIPVDQDHSRGAAVLDAGPARHVRKNTGSRPSSALIREPRMPKSMPGRPRAACLRPVLGVNPHDLDLAVSSRRR